MTGEVEPQHLSARVQREQVARSYEPLPPPSEFRTDGLGVLTTIERFLDHSGACEVLVTHLPMLAADGLRLFVAHLSPYRLAASAPAISTASCARSRPTSPPTSRRNHQ
ncbi:hypothetical protein [Kitasatospora acidiphila]|uniref:hypothetical protein n=1 Tax=Kitasatospora acidiphila TaxID=2567942 RepID=UPI003C741AA8